MKHRIEGSIMALYVIKTYQPLPRTKIFLSKRIFMSYAFSGLFENLLKKIYVKKLLKILNVLFTTRDITYLYILKFFHGPRYV